MNGMMPVQTGPFEWWDCTIDENDRGVCYTLLPDMEVMDGDEFFAWYTSRGSQLENDGWMIESDMWTTVMIMGAV